MAVFAPRPRARVRMATSVKPGLFRMARRAKRRSAARLDMKALFTSLDFRREGRLGGNTGWGEEGYSLKMGSVASLGGVRTCTSSLGAQLLISWKRAVQGTWNLGPRIEKSGVHFLDFTRMVNVAEMFVQVASGEYIFAQPSEPKNAYGASQIRKSTLVRGSGLVRKHSPPSSLTSSVTFWSGRSECRRLTTLPLRAACGSPSG